MAHSALAVEAGPNHFVLHRVEGATFGARIADEAAAVPAMVPPIEKRELGFAAAHARVRIFIRHPRLFQRVGRLRGLHWRDQVRR